MSARFTLEQISKMSPKIQAQVSSQLRTASSPTQPDKTPPKPKEQAKNRIRQKSAGLNKTEQAFKDYLTARVTSGFTPHSQSITLKIGNGVRYTPDFIATTYHECGSSGGALEITAYEVKGFMRDDAAVKLKVAASLYPWIKFHLVTRKKGGWQIQEVLP